MRRHDHRDSRRTERTDTIHHEHLIAEIEACCRLIHAQELRLLCDGTRQEDKLPFSAADLRIDLLRKMRDVKHFDRIVRNPLIFFPGNAKTADVGSSSHHNDIMHGEGEGGRMHLRDVGDATRPLLHGPCGHILTG